MGNPKGIKRDFGQLEQRRFEAARLFDQGFSKADVARLTGVSFASARRWFEAWRSAGHNGLKRAGRAGRKARLNDLQLEEIQSALAAGPIKNGFPATQWNVSRIRSLIERLTGVTYHPEHVSRILRRIGVRWHDRVGRKWRTPVSVVFG